jgi:hypothetical protein
MRHRSVAPFLSLLLAAIPAGQLLAQPAQVLDLHQVMADPDWIGAPVERMWWSWDAGSAYYSAKRIDSNVRDTWAQPIEGGTALLVDGAARGSIDAVDPLYDANRTQMAFVRNGDVFVRDLRSGALRQLTRSEALESQLQWSRDGALVWRSGNDWFRWTSAAGTGQAASLKAEDAPDQAPKADDLRDRQLRYIDTLRVERSSRTINDSGAGWCACVASPPGGRWCWPMTAGVAGATGASGQAATSACDRAAMIESVT